MFDAIFYTAHMNIARLRKAKGLSQTDLASMIGVEQPTISRIEKGSDGVTLRLLRQVAEALDTDIVTLFRDSREDGEDIIVQAYREISPERRQGWDDLARALLADQLQSRQ